MRGWMRRRNHDHHHHHDHHDDHDHHHNYHHNDDDDDDHHHHHHHHHDHHHDDDHHHHDDPHHDHHHHDDHGHHDHHHHDDDPHHDHHHHDDHDHRHDDHHDVDHDDHDVGPRVQLRRRRAGTPLVHDVDGLRHLRPSRRRRRAELLHARLRRPVLRRRQRRSPVAVEDPGSGELDHACFVQRHDAHADRCVRVRDRGRYAAEQPLRPGTDDEAQHGVPRQRRLRLDVHDHGGLLTRRDPLHRRRGRTAPAAAAAEPSQSVPARAAPASTTPAAAVRRIRPIHRAAATRIARRPSLARPVPVSAVPTRISAASPMRTARAAPAGR